MLVFDLDDTLLDRSKRIGPRTRQALDRWLDNGGEIVFATARPQRSVRAFIAPELLARCHSITLNGAVIQAKGAVPQGFARIGEQARAVVEHADLSGRSWMSIECFGEHFASNVTHSDEELHRYHSATPNMLIPLHALDYADVSKLAIDGLGNCLRSDMARLQAAGLTIIPALNHTFLNVVDPSVDKSTGVQALLEKLGRSVADITVFGDDIPDLKMMAMAPIKVAMGNARDDVKAIADYVIGDCDSDSIADFIEARCA